MCGKWQQERRRYPGSWRRARMLFCWFRTTFSRRFIPARFSTFLTSCDARSDRAMRCHRTFARYSSEACPSCSIFPGNTKKQRVWFRAPFEQADVEHELHFIDGPDDVCKRQLKDRSKHLPTGSPSTTVADFDAITAYLKRLRLRSA